MKSRKSHSIFPGPGSSIWLSSSPAIDAGCVLNKMAFALYAWHFHLLPQNCVCGQKIKVEHALSCKKGVFITIRHNQVRETTANLIKMICKDLKIKPPLRPLSGKSLSERTANIQDTARVDLSAKGFWMAGRNAFFDVRFFNASAKRYRKKTLK